jgi:hypothetical protein
MGAFHTVIVHLDLGAGKNQGCIEGVHANISKKFQ